MVQKARNLFEAATSRGRVIRAGDIVCIVMDGAGSVIVSTMDFVQAQKWAQSKIPSANLLTDRARFLDQFSVLVSRPGSMQVTRGNDRQLSHLASAMAAAGYSLAEWALPIQLRRVNTTTPTDAPLRRKTDRRIADRRESDRGEGERRADAPAAAEAPSGGDPPTT